MYQAHHHPECHQTSQIPMVPVCCPGEPGHDGLISLMQVSVISEQIKEELEPVDQPPPLQ